MRIPWAVFLLCFAASTAVAGALFEDNRGQFPPPVRFAAPGDHATPLVENRALYFPAGTPACGWSSSGQPVRRLRASTPRPLAPPPSSLATPPPPLRSPPVSLNRSASPASIPPSTFSSTRTAPTCRHRVRRRSRPRRQPRCDSPPHRRHRSCLPGARRCAFPRTDPRPRPAAYQTIAGRRTLSRRASNTPA